VEEDIALVCVNVAVSTPAIMNVTPSLSQTHVTTLSLFTSAEMKLFISRFNELLSHSRFFIKLRSAQGQYHSLILFRLTPAADLTWGPTKPVIGPGMLEKAANRQIYVMESQCPHLGADLSHCDIEEYEDTTVAVCPWHRYSRRCGLKKAHVA
jgi:hypothetical protein